MKVAIITDTHFGTRKNSEIFLNSQKKFIKDQFVPYLKDNSITKVFLLGDLYDNRSQTNNMIMNAVFDLFNDDLKPFEVYLLIGNHDCYYNSTIDVNSLKNLSVFNNVHLIDKITEIDIDGRHIVLTPWIVDNSNFIDTLNRIENPDVLMGHFNIFGFKYNKVKTSDDGLSIDSFNKCKKVFSGHFHIRNKLSYNNTEIIYVGAPYQLTRNDIDEERGFIVLDTETLEYEYINNNLSLKYKQLKFPEVFSKETIKGNIVDVLVDYDESYNESKIEKYVKKIEEYEPADTPNIIINNNNKTDSVDLSINVGSVSELIKEYIDLMEIENKPDIYNNLIELYNDAKGDLL